MKRALPGAVAFTLLLAACGEAGPLDGVGERASEWVHEVEIPPTVAPVVDVEVDNTGLIETTDVLWFNDDLDDQATAGEPDDVVAAVWARQAGSRFVQASRAEVAAALPGMRFPGQLPPDVRWITSQLVFEASTGTLDGDTAAAFGLWQVEPYSITDGRVGVLRVGPASEGVGVERTDVVPILVPDGISLGWTEAGLRFELFCRSAVPEELCERVAGSFVPLSDLLPQGTGA